MESWELAAREAIRDLVARYNANGDSGRLDAVLALFEPDATLAVDGRDYEGAPAIRAMFEAATGQTRAVAGSYIRHFTATHQIDVIDRDRATGRCYFQVLTEGGLDHWGRYLDEYRRGGARWRFSKRAVRVDGRVPGGWAERTQAQLDG